MKPASHAYGWNRDIWLSARAGVRQGCRTERYNIGRFRSKKAGAMHRKTEAASWALLGLGIYSALCKREMLERAEGMIHSSGDYR